LTTKQACQRHERTEDFLVIDCEASFHSIQLPYSGAQRLEAKA